ncbi:MAG: HAMP domain-containing protein [Desulfacinum sp.]|jgi:signal transduction histidine kinase|nr:HAMP domain-containing protein [Desulfacinum sp.]
MRGGSVYRRFVGVGTALIAASSFVVAFFGWQVTSGYVEARYHEHFRVLADYAASRAELGLVLNDPAMLQALAEELLALEAVREVVITDGGGRRMARAWREIPGRARSVTAPVWSPTLDRSNPALENGSGLESGRVTLVYAVQGLEALLRSLVVRFTLAGVLVALASVGLYGLLARGIVSPLRDLVEAARQVSAGRLDVRVRPKGLKETDVLAETFNEMVTALEQREQDLRRLNARMARRDALAEVGRFSMMVAHEIKNPLAIIRGSLDQLKREGPGGASAPVLWGFMEEELTRINRLVEDFLLFSKPAHASPVRTDMNRWLAQVLEKIRLMAEDAEKALHVRVAEDPCWCACDPELMERAVGHLVRNALDAVDGHGAVRVAAAARGHAWVLTVEDDGPGVPPEHRERVFEPFFTTKAKGSGLGLAMVQRIVEVHGGTVRLESAQGGGARFVVSIPRRE